MYVTQNVNEASPRECFTTKSSIVDVTIMRYRDNGSTRRRRRRRPNPSNESRLLSTMQNDGAFGRLFESKINVENCQKLIVVDLRLYQRDLGRFFDCVCGSENNFSFSFFSFCFFFLISETRVDSKL